MPLRHDRDADLAELTAYLRWLSGRAEVVVVDGSAPRWFERHRRAWGDLVVHVRPDPELRCANGKVAGVITGVCLVRAERVIIADDDVRYDGDALAAVAGALDGADLVVPQNYFRPTPWHCRWDTARSLLNRAFAHDYPGTLAVRRTAFHRFGCYDGDVLFENLELIRTVRARGGTVQYLLSPLVRRLPPDVRTFLSQRVRQAYDSFAQPWRLAAELAILPAAVAAARRGGRLVAGGLVAAALLAEAGRRRAGAAAVYPADSALWVPLWLAERGVCSWLAVGTRVLRGGVSYRDGRLRVAAHSAAQLRDRVKVTGVKARRAGWGRPSSRAPARTRSAG
ncbi:glycosyltransferase [Amycolatopsis rifamycinica]|uniref:glycosyltransferase n=1 Tax=Amycolatopsis rifamycinica TaxID=287986 RepID=UPI0007C57A92|nr:glycosyltransferase family 2 protein [Amycolatopsis rifamycinica]